ncbi:MAG: hypothetical protein IKV78_05265 [Methanocorpusculum sp.]|nr:hypothetical protein [Methanocorpusculum sp.]
MGHGYSFECPNCKSSVNFLEGIGFGYYSTFDRLFFGDELEIKESIPAEIWETVQNLLKDGWKPKDYTYQVCYCPDCKTLEQCTVFTLEKDGKTYTPKYSCTCGTELIKCNPLKMGIPFTITCKECKTKFSAKPNPCLSCWD